MSDSVERGKLAIALAKLEDCPEWLTPEQIELLKTAGVDVPQTLPVIVPYRESSARALRMVRFERLKEGP